VFPYSDHQRYFAEAIRPRLGHTARFLGNLDFSRKRHFLTGARCVLIPSLVAETSSLVAMEAIACGTPVVAFPTGALAEIIEPGVTGFFVRNTREMAEAIHAADTIDRERCREIARHRFALEGMVDRYFELYRHLTRCRGSVR
jgi:glycosyltransferase involved in cell wall biosynthesis